MILLHLPPDSGGATLAFGFYLIAILTDYLDGWWARKYRQVSDFGKFFDALTDKILTLGLFVSFLSMGILPAWTLLLVLFILTREFLITGMRLVAVRKGVVLAAEKSGKIKTAFQMASLGILMATHMLLYDYPDFLGDDLWRALYLYGGIGLFCAAAALTVFSGVLYLGKYGKLLLDPQVDEVS